MSRILHVQASPRGNRSVSVQVAEALLGRYKQLHADDAIETIDLAAADLPVFDAPAAAAKYAVMGGQKPAGHAEEAWAEVIEAIHAFTAAEKVVISCPMWNFGIPYRLKHYIDLLVQPGLTFRYDPESGYTGLVTGRPVALILARGGDYSDEAAKAVDFQEPYLRMILQFIGFQDIHSIFIQPTLIAGPEAAEAALTAAKTEAEAFAERF